jgi:hypothetical protein
MESDKKSTEKTPQFIFDKPSYSSMITFDFSVLYPSSLSEAAQLNWESQQKKDKSPEGTFKEDCE